MRASPHVALPRVNPLPTTTHHPRRSIDSAASTLRWWDPRASRGRESSASRKKRSASSPSAGPLILLVVHDSPTRGDAQQVREPALPTLQGSPRLASSRLALPSALPARLFAATCTRDSYLFAAADTPRCSLWCVFILAHTASSCVRFNTCARARMCMFDYSHARLPIPCRLSTSHAPGISFETVRSFLSLFLSLLLSCVSLSDLSDYCPSSTRDENDDQLVPN